MTGFRLPADVVASWKDALAPHRAAKGVEDVMKGLLQALQTESGDGHVAVQRHHLFSWQQTLAGAAARGVPALQPVADEMGAYLAGRSGPGAGAGASVSASAGAALSATPTTFAPSAAPPVPPPSPSPSSGYVAPPAVVYQKAASPASAASGAARLVPDRDVANFVGEMLRDARAEVLVVSPWGAVGLDTLANAILNLPQGVAVACITRRPPQEDDAYHRNLAALRKRNVDVAFSPNLLTRMVLVDGQRLLLGAASLPPAGAPARETAIATTDAALVAAARENFWRLHADAKAGR